MNQVLLLNNLGTPDSPEPKDVGRYLQEFLMDPDVVSIPYPIRWFLVNCIIVPRRKYSSAENYKKVWTQRGSPLAFHTEDVAKKLQTRLQDYHVAHCMRYGSPSIAKTVESLVANGAKSIDFLPLYPQYADATTGSSVKKFKEVMQIYPDVKYRLLEDFYNDPNYISASVNLYKKALDLEKFEHFVFSFHGLPEKVIKNGYGQGHCLQTNNCCFIDCEANKKCYVSHCKRSASAIAKALNLPDEKVTVAFQSRLGPTKWIQPYTDSTIVSLAKAGIKNVAVFSPSFVADCLETLEELQMELKETFIEHGGENLEVSPCLNSEEQWLDHLSTMVQKKFPN